MSKPRRNVLSNQAPYTPTNRLIQEAIPRDAPREDITQVQYVYRLDSRVYADLVSKLPKLHVASDTTGIQTAFHMGIQHVLEVLRKGYVVE